MTSFFIFALSLIAVLVAAMTALATAMFRGDRRLADARARRLRARDAQPAASTPANNPAIHLADRRKLVRTDVDVERRAA